MKRGCAVVVVPESGGVDDLEDKTDSNSVCGVKFLGAWLGIMCPLRDVRSRG